jgi:hypothetical protein
MKSAWSRLSVVSSGGFGVSGIETTGFTTTVLVTYS